MSHSFKQLGLPQRLPASIVNCLPIANLSTRLGLLELSDVILEEGFAEYFSLLERYYCHTSTFLENKVFGYD
jgi:hypothetical protein